MINLVSRTNYPNLANVGIDTFSLTVQATPGNTLIVVIAENLTSAVTASITDDVGDVFVQVNGVAFSTPSVGLSTTDIWYCIGCGAATTISFLTSGSPIIWVYEISGTDIQFDAQGTIFTPDGSHGGLSTNLAVGPSIAGEQVTFTCASAANFGSIGSAATFREGAGSAQFYVTVENCPKEPTSVNLPWTLDVVSATNRFKNLGASWLLVTPPTPNFPSPTGGDHFTPKQPLIAGPVQVIPLDNSPNQVWKATVIVNGKPVTLSIILRYNEIAKYWVATIRDTNGNVLLDSLPFVTGDGPSQNLLAQFAYLGIGSATVFNASQVAQ